jgi:glyoxylase-like metal-dependent hydrolase (beta-lactamase superfamily II)
MPCALRTCLRLTPVLVIASGAVDRRQAPPADGFDVQRIAEGVYAAIRTDPPGLMFEANAGFIIGADEAVVIDGGSNPSSAQALLAALRSLTDRPVRTVIATHWHDDHVIGLQVWRDTFPDVDVVAHVTAWQDLTTDGAANRRQMAEQGPGTVAFLRGLLEQSKGLDREPITDEERASHASSIALAEKHIAQIPLFRPVRPTVEVADRLTLERAGRALDVRWLGRGHTRGDLVVHLPAEGIAFAGDLVSWPVPLVGTTSFPADFAATVEKLIALRAGVLVPGHGPVLREDAHIRAVARLLAAIRDGTAAAVARGETLEQTRRSVDLSEFRRALAGESRVWRLLFDSYVAGPAVARAYEQALAVAR